MDFPHISDTKFPDLKTVDVYKYQNNFDYGRWTGKVSIKLLNVLWNSNYADVPGFITDSERDEWFDEQPGLIKTLESAFNITPQNIVKIPVPYNDAYRFNYLVVDMPIQTSANEPLDYELENTRVKRWYYFIEGMTQTAPSTTELQITLDVWVTFINTVNIPYLMLERGHAPMFETNVEQYLRSPLDNSEYLLADDFNYGTKDNVIQSSSYIPVNNEKKWVVFVCTMNENFIAELRGGGAWEDGSSTLPTFYDLHGADERWGYQLGVSGYQWHYGGADYSNANLPVRALLSEEYITPNGNLAFAIDSTVSQQFFDTVANYYVNFLHSINAVFVVDETMLNLREPFIFAGFTVYIANKQNSEVFFTLNKEAFNFDEKYSELTKLYTSPYSMLEITDDNGFSADVRIENISALQFHKELSIAFPFLQYQMFFTGINGMGRYQYNWKRLNDSVSTKTIWESDFSKFMMKWDIPTYAVYVSQEAEYATTNFAPIQARREGAITDYQNAVRFGNTTKANVDDSMQTNTDNVAASAQTNVDNIADTGTLMEDNTELATRTATKNMTEVHNVRQENVVNYNNYKINKDKDIATALNFAQTSLRNDYAIAAYGNNSVATLASGVIGAAGGLTIGGLERNATGASVAAGGLVSLAQTLPQIHAAGTNLVASVTTDVNLANAFANANAAYAQQATQCNTNVLEQQQIEGSQLTANNNDLAINQTANTVETNNGNATRTQGTENGNATRTQGTETNNALWNRNANVVAQQNNLRQKQREVSAQYQSNRLGKPIKATDYNGDGFPDAFERRGVRVNIRTQSKAAIAQAGDAFLRFGYALHRVWDMSNGFHYGNHFTFWKAEDIWINEGSGLAGNAVNQIGDILLKGVTVWRDASEIGKVSIYDNI